MDIRGKSIYAFVDAANLFFGGEKSLRWRIDYKKLFEFLKGKYNVTKVFYYSGIDVEGYKEEGKEINLEKLVRYFEAELLKKDKTEAERTLLEKHLERAKFYQDLDSFGYDLRLKATKVFTSADGTIMTKANCDVDLTFDLMRFMSQYCEAIILSGDGDFAPILEYLMRKNKKIRVLARFERTAREIKELSGEDFVDFKSIRAEIEAGKVSKKVAVQKNGESGVRLPRREYTPRNDGGKKREILSVLNRSQIKSGMTENRGDRNDEKKSFLKKIPMFRKGF